VHYRHACLNDIDCRVFLKAGRFDPGFAAGCLSTFYAIRKCRWLRDKYNGSCCRQQASLYVTAHNSPACLPACLRFIVPDLSPIYTHLIYSQGLRLLDDLRNYRTHLHAEWAGHCPNLKLDFYESWSWIFGMCIEIFCFASASRTVPWPQAVRNFFRRRKRGQSM